MRLFVALRLPEALSRAVQERVQPIRDRLGAGNIRWTPAEQFHFTLKFLGDGSEDQVEALSRQLTEALAEQVAIPVALEGLGSFPPKGKPRVLWIGVTSGSDALTELARRLDQTCHAAGFALEDRPFHAHLTLARIAFLADARPLQALIDEHRSAVFGRFSGAAVSLMNSRLLPQGSEYSVVKEFTLAD
jgi:RNA 2',3'-cyclic 3'-phosphodiesterase